MRIKKWLIRARIICQGLGKAFEMTYVQPRHGLAELVTFFVTV